MLIGVGSHFVLPKPFFECKEFSRIVCVSLFSYQGSVLRQLHYFNTSSNICQQFFSFFISEFKTIGTKDLYFSCQTVDKIIKAVKKGVDLMGTSYITVRQMNQLKINFQQK